MSLFQIDAGKEWRGGQRQSFFLAKELKGRGLPFVFVVQPESPLHQKALEAELPVLALKIRSEFDLRAILRLAWAMKRRKCLLAHFHDAHAVAVGSAAASLAKVHYRVITRRVDFPLKRNYFSRRKYKKNVDAIIAISDRVKRVMIGGGVNRKLIEVIPSGIDFSAFDEVSSRDYLRREFSFAPDDYLVGIVAALADHKGHKYLIQAMKILKEHSARIKLVIVGHGPLQMDLDRQAKESGVEDIVFFLGFRQDVPQILASLDLFVLSSYLEGLGSSILDAMASRLAVVATQTGGIPEIVVDGETGLLVPPRDPEALAQAILRLYNDRELAARFGQRGYELVHQKFSAEAMAKKVVDVYERIGLASWIKLHQKEKGDIKD